MYYCLRIDFFACKITVPTAVGAVTGTRSAPQVMALDDIFGVLLPTHETDHGVGGTPDADSSYADEGREVLVGTIHAYHHIEGTHQFQFFFKP